MNAQVYEEASEWVVRNRTEALDRESRERFDGWLRRSPEHIQAYLEMSSIWEALPDAMAASAPTADALSVSLRPGIASVVELRPLVRERKDGAEAGTRARAAAGAGAATRRLLPAAAAALVAVAGAWLYTTRGTYETGFGEQRSLVLEDGSRIELNSRSRVRVRYTDSARRVELLQGQALFEVAKNPSRPFVVRSGDAYLRAVGTEFEVYRGPQGTVVTVVEGKVAVMPTLARMELPIRDEASLNRVPRKARTPAEVLVSAGEQMTVQPAASTSPHPANVEAALAWTRRMLVFEGAPLEHVAAEFNRYSKRQIVVVGDIPRSIRVSGAFSSADPAVLLQFLRAQPELRIDDVDDEIRIRYQ